MATVLLVGKKLVSIFILSRIIVPGVVTRSTRQTNRVRLPVVPETSHGVVPAAAILYPRSTAALAPSPTSVSEISKVITNAVTSAIKKSPSLLLPAEPTIFIVCPMVKPSNRKSLEPPDRVIVSGLASANVRSAASVVVTGTLSSQREPVNVPKPASGSLSQSMNVGTLIGLRNISVSPLTKGTSPSTVVVSAVPCMSPKFSVAAT